MVGVNEQATPPPELRIPDEDWEKTPASVRAVVLLTAGSRRVESREPGVEGGSGETAGAGEPEFGELVAAAVE